MANKTNIEKDAKQAVTNIAANAGLLLMTAAATTLMIELPDHPNPKATLNAQPVFATPGTAEHQAGGGNEMNEMRRERDETHPHYQGYSLSQRTPGRTGKV